MALKCVSKGQCINWDTLLTLKGMAGLVTVLYWRATTKLQHYWGFEIGVPCLEGKCNPLTIGVGNAIYWSIRAFFGRSKMYFHSDKWRESAFLVTQCQESNVVPLNL